MLEGVFVIADVVVVVVGVGEEVVVLGEDVCGADVWRWQVGCFWGLELVDLFGVVAEVFAELVAQVGVGVFVAYDFDGIVNTYGAVVGSNDDFVVGER